MAIKQIAYSLIFCLACSFGFAQRGISYQGVILYPTVEIPGVDSSVTPYSERDVCMRFSIYDENNVLEYIETHTTTTDYYGQVNLVIGRGDNPSPASRLDGLRWDGTAKFLKVDLDYDAACINWTDVSYDELHYVPFAFYALNADGVGTDNQNLTGATLTGTSLQIDIENGTSATVDLAPLQVGAGTDDQNLTGATLTGTSLQIDIEDGSSATVDLAALNTDDQNLTGATLTGTSLQIDIEDGNSATVDLAALNTDDQNLTGATLTGTSLQIDIEDGNSATVDLAALVNDADNDTTNEIQDLSLNAKVLELSNDPTGGVDLVNVLDLTDISDVSIMTPIDNEVLTFESGLWVNKPLKDLQRIELASSYPAAPVGNPLIVGLPSSPSSGNTRFVNIDEVDILIIDNSSDNSFVSLQDLDLAHNGKILKIVESDNQNPKITTVLDQFYSSLNPNDDNYLFIDSQEIIIGGGKFPREIKYESVEFLWQDGIWIPMR